MRLSSSGIKYTKPYTTTGVFAPPKPFLEIFFQQHCSELTQSPKAPLISPCTSSLSPRSKGPATHVSPFSQDDP